MPIRLSVSLGSVLEANVFYWAAIGGASVISCSWGPPDRGGAESDQCFPLPASTRLAIDYAVTHGRYGKGCLIFFAAGNGNENMDTDAYASYEKTIAVAACNDKSRKSQYSDYGRAVWCAFPSSDSMSESPETGTTDSCGIWTTDVRGIEAGYNTGKTSDPFGNYAPEFGGTSSASPGAAGVAALVLAVNPNLYWEEVKQILADTCDKISHPEEGELGQYNALGHSHYYGYGRLNAEKAVLLARMRLDNAILPPQIEKPLHNCR